MKPIRVTQSGTGSTDWKQVNWQIYVQIGLAVVVTGAVTYSVEYTYDNVTEPDMTSPTVFTHPTLAGLSADADGSFETPIAFFRLSITAGTGSATMTYIQSGIAG